MNSAGTVGIGNRIDHSSAETSPFCVVALTSLASVYEEPELDPGEKVVLDSGPDTSQPKPCSVAEGSCISRATACCFEPTSSIRPYSAETTQSTCKLTDVRAVGSTPHWRAAMGRRFLRVDDRDRSYLFLFSVRHPHWRRRYVDQIVQVSPEVAIVDGWERTELDSHSVTLATSTVECVPIRMLRPDQAPLERLVVRLHDQPVTYAEVGTTRNRGRLPGISTTGPPSSSALAPKFGRRLKARYEAGKDTGTPGPPFRPRMPPSKRAPS